MSRRTDRRISNRTAKESRVSEIPKETIGPCDKDPCGRAAKRMEASHERNGQAIHGIYFQRSVWEHLLSVKFATNAMILQTAMMAFNPSADGRRIGQGLLALKEILPMQVTVQKRRLRSVLQDPSADGYLACKYVQRSHRHFLKFNHTSPWLRAVEVLYARL